MRLLDLLPESFQTSSPVTQSLCSWEYVPRPQLCWCVNVLDLGVFLVSLFLIKTGNKQREMEPGHSLSFIQRKYFVAIKNDLELEPLVSWKGVQHMLFREKNQVKIVRY